MMKITDKRTFVDWGNIEVGEVFVYTDKDEDERKEFLAIKVINQEDNDVFLDFEMWQVFEYNPEYYKCKRVASSELIIK